MGAISGVGVDKEPLANGYLHGQLWNRRKPNTGEYICFRVTHLSITAMYGLGLDDHLGAINSAFYGDPLTGLNYVIPPGVSQEEFGMRIDAPGYYSDIDPLIPSAFVLSGWSDQDGAVRSPRVRYSDLVLRGDMPSNYYYDDLFLPNLWWAKEASIVRAQGFDSLPGTLQVGDAAATTETSWVISNVFFDEFRRSTDLYLDLKNLGNYRYCLIEFSAECGIKDALHSRPTLLNLVSTISASSVSSYLPLNDWELYPNHALNELGAMQRAVDSPHSYFTTTNFATTRAFLYDQFYQTGRWIPASEPIDYFGF
jgi:hypothetical protein